MLSIAVEVCAIVACVSIGGAPANGPTQGYSLQVVAKTGQSIGGNTITNFTQPAVLNDQGTLVFAAASNTGPGLFTPDAVIAKAGDTIDGKTLTSVTSPAMNQSGNIAFLAGYSGGSGIFTPSQAMVNSGDTIDGQKIFNFYQGIALDDNGDVAFEASTGSSFPIGTGVFFTANNGSSRLLISPGQSVNGKALAGVGTPVVSRSGVVGIRGDFVNNADPNDTGILTIDTAGDATPNLLAETGSTVDGKTLTVFGFPSGVTSEGAAISTANFDGGSGLFRLAPQGSGTSNLLVQTGTTIGGLTLTQIGQTAVNSKGDFAFFGTFSGGQGIFTPSDVLVKTGDRVGLNTITAILLNSTAYNANGTIAFVAQLDDGSKALVVGTPAAGQ
jgi:hypothetical protein